MSHTRRGVTMVELMVALAILALMASVSTVALRKAEERAPATNGSRIADAKREAITLGRPVRVILRDSTVGSALALPDGRIIGTASEVPHASH